MNASEHVKAEYRRFAENECRGNSDHYFDLARAVADDDQVVEFIARMPVTQPNLFFASIQFLTGPDHMPRSRVELKEAVDGRRNEIATLMQSRRTQTNEVGRCAAILRALPRGRLALVEVGASAGLCLLLDGFYYDYGTQQVGDPASPVRLRCTARNSLPTLDAIPEIVWRSGLDLSPVDVRSADDARWLMSCVWPDQPERRERLAAAIRLAQSRNLRVRQGDLVSELPSLLAEVPPDAHLTIFHSAVLCYVSDAHRRAFAEVLANASKSRPITWITNEAWSVIPEITALANQPRSSAFLLGRTSFNNRERKDELLALAHFHGADLEWFTAHESNELEGVGI
jgi:hypothetical protein